jgi:hypothetical protein
MSGGHVVIRSEQLAALDKSFQNQYHKDVRNFLRENFPELVARLDSRTLLERVETAAPKARSYGIRTTEGVLAYIGLSIAAGPAFHTNPKICSFLESKADDPDLKIRWMFQRVVENLQGIAGELAENRNRPRQEG